MNKRFFGLFMSLVLAVSATLTACTGDNDDTSSIVVSSEQTQSDEQMQSDATSSAGDTASENSSEENSVDYSYQLNDDGSVSMGYGAILHAWCWSFNTITENLQDIADAGYTSIQTSPINECKVGEDGGMELYGDGKWYYHYQPTDYVIGNYQLGTLEEFETMCQKANELGLKIIVDVPMNHVSSDLTVVSENILNICDEPFHGRGEISTYESRKQVTQGDLLGLKDLNTQAPEVQQYLLSYLKSCIDAGASGFRFDAAKHIELPDDDEEFASDFWTVVLDNGAEFQYGEILHGGSERIADYAQLMNVTASRYGEIIRTAITGDSLSVSTIESYSASGVSEDSLVTWVESHDNYCNDASWEQMDETDVEYGWAIIAARSGGAPLFYSRPMGSSLESQWGNNVIGEAGSDAYKSDNVAALNHFRNEMAGFGETLTNPDEDKKVLMIERGDKGAVIINKSDAEYELNGADSVLADGTYNDKVTGAEFTVSDGKISGTVPSGAIIVIY